MADRQDTSQDFNPRHRVAGAIILVVLAVVLVPLVLQDHAPSGPAPPTVEVPEPATRVVVTPLTPVPFEDNRQPATVKTIPSLTASATPPAGDQTEATRPANDVQAQNTSTPARVVPSPKPPTTAVRTPDKGWIVQVGAFSRMDNALRLKQNLVRHGYASEMDKISLNKGKGVRVRVGPYTTEADAQTALTRIQREFGIKGVVRAYP